MSEIEHRDGMWYKDGAPWYSEECMTDSFVESEIRGHEHRIVVSQEAVEDWHEVQRIRTEEKCNAGIENLIAVYRRHSMIDHTPSRWGLAGVRNEVLRMVARGELEVPKDV